MNEYTLGTSSEEAIGQLNQVREEARQKHVQVFALGSQNSRILFFAFDGTKNSKDEPGLGLPTNVARLYESARRQLPNTDSGDAFYYPGPGTQKNGFVRTVDTLTGISVESTAATAYAQLVWYANQNPDIHLTIATTGFSRGSATARQFLNVVWENGIPETSSRVSQGFDPLSGKEIFGYTRYLVPPHQVDLGIAVLYDSVATGAARADEFQRIPPAPGLQVYHLIAADEHRDLFRVDSILDSDNVADPRLHEWVIPGAHSDVGGSYAANGIGLLSLEIFHSILQNSGVPMAPLPPNQVYEGQPLVIHDSFKGLYGPAAGPGSAGYISTPRLDNAYRYNNPGQLLDRQVITADDGSRLETLTYSDGKEIILSRDRYLRVTREVVNSYDSDRRFHGSEITVPQTDGTWVRLHVSASGHVMETVTIQRFDEGGRLESHVPVNGAPYLLVIDSAGASRVIHLAPTESDAASRYMLDAQGNVVKLTATSHDASGHYHARWEVIDGIDIGTTSDVDVDYARNDFSWRVALSSMAVGFAAPDFSQLSYTLTRTKPDGTTVTREVQPLYDEAGELRGQSVRETTAVNGELRSGVAIETTLEPVTRERTQTFDRTVFDSSGAFAGRGVSTTTTSPGGLLTYELDVSYGSSGQITSTTLTERRPDNTLLTTVRDGQGQIVSSRQLQILDDDTRLEYVAQGNMHFVSATATDGTVTTREVLTQATRQVYEDTLYSDMAGFIGALHGKDRLGVALYGAKIVIDQQLLAGRSPSLGGAQTAVQTMSSVVGMVAALNALASHDTLTQLNGAVGLLSSANQLAAVVGGKDAALLSGDSLRLLQQVGAVLSIANLRNLDDMLDNGQLGSAAMSVVGPDEAILAWDHNADGLIDRFDEIEFWSHLNQPEPGLPDLQALARPEFDSNQDGVFDGSDAKWSAFRLWQDRNGNGVSDAGELQTLAQAGVKALHLQANVLNRAYGTGAVVRGYTRLEMADGRLLQAGDVQLRPFDAVNDATAAPEPGSDQAQLLTAQQTQALAERAQQAQAARIASGADNRAPETMGFIPTQFVDESQRFNLEIAPNFFIDGDGERLNLAATRADGSALPAWLRFDAATLRLSGTPEAADAGGLNVRLTATDAAGASTSATFSVQVLPINDAPYMVRALDPVRMAVGRANTYLLPVDSFSDDDRGDALTFSVTAADGAALPSWLRFDPATRALAGTPSAAQLDAPRALRITATDLSGASVSTLVTVVAERTGTANDDALAGTSASEWIEAGAGNDHLDGGAGADTLRGGQGDDVYVVDAFDSLIERAGEGTDTVRSAVGWTLGEHLENLALTGAADAFAIGNGLDNVLTGNRGANTIEGAAGGDRLDGGFGRDTLRGGAGDDTLDGGVAQLVHIHQTGPLLKYYDASGELLGELPSSATASVIRAGAAGQQLVIHGGATVDKLYVGLGTRVDARALGAGVDEIHLTGSRGQYRIERDGDDLVLTRIAGLGAGQTEDVKVRVGSAQAADRLLFADGAIGTFALGNLLASGAALVLETTARSNPLDAGFQAQTQGADRLEGGLGDDTYQVDDVGDVVFENPGEGTDTVRSSVSHTLANNVENLTLTGTAALNATGNGSANTLIGNAADNVLNGRAGADRLVGGAGNDTYVLDNAGDVVVEAANEGIDSVQSSVSHTLAANVENLTLTGSAAINGSGNTLANILTGNAANNVLNGGGGADRLVGGAGNDTYVVDHAGDVVVEAANQGTDTVQTSLTYTLGAHVENLTLVGGAALGGTGNEVANTLTGNSAANLLDGRAGNDLLVGGAGNDSYRFARGYGADRIVENDARAGNTDVALFGSDISSRQLWFSRAGDDLAVNVIGSADTLTVAGWYLGSAQRVEQFRAGDGRVLLESQVQQLVQAMAQFAPPPMGQTQLTASQGAALEATLAASWR